MKILITGFGPFHTNNENPTRQILKMLPKHIDDTTIIGIELPVSYEDSFTKLKDILKKEKPDVVVSLGLAQGRKWITPERIAVNIDDASIADNDGIIKEGQKIVEDGQAAYFTSLPIEAITKELTKANIPAKISNSAGVYICNHIMYHVLHFSKLHGYPKQAGFIHVPLMDEQDHDESLFSMPIQTIFDAIMISLRTIIEEG
jgi:pyroglutamyl-peptidase